MTAALVADVLADGLGHGIEVREDFLDGFLLQPGGAGDGEIEFAHVGGVMLVVVNLHRLGVDVGLQRVIVVAQRRKLEHALGSGRPEAGWGRGSLGVKKTGRQGDRPSDESEIFQGVAASDHTVILVSWRFLRKRSLNSTSIDKPKWILHGRDFLKAAPFGIVVDYVHGLDAGDILFKMISPGDDPIVVPILRPGAGHQIFFPANWTEDL